jgi:hypothetical protein
MSAMHIARDLIRHPNDSFERECADLREVYSIASAYVKAFGHHLGLDEALTSGLSLPLLNEWTPADPDEAPPDDALVLRWVRIEAPGSSPDWRSSFLVKRGEGANADQWGVLFAAACRRDSPENQIHFSRPRLRLVFTVFERSKTLHVRFSGMTLAHGQPDAHGADPIEHVKPGRPAAKDTYPVSGKVFALDPASQVGEKAMPACSPNQPSRTFESLQSDGALGELPATADRVYLSDPYVHVFNSSLLPPEQAALTKQVEVAKAGDGWRTTETRARTDDFAAINAFHHCRSLFRRMDSWGVKPEQYFRCAELPIGIDYRSDFDRGSGGMVRNADVRWTSPPRLDARGTILMRFGLADVTETPAEGPLGIACDLRWCWHELSHVLLMAAVGEREFRFCHSAGDALAAMMSDPRSKLRSPEWRGVTFPWAALERRHDRLAREGWAWGGALDSDDDGYWQEQILSSSLFRLYQALGGDSPEEATRAEAADYTAYLIVQAIGLLGPAAIVPAASVDHFVSALIDADVGTSSLHKRVGGTAHKVVRWAFEQQGLYTAEGEIVSGPGEPEPVDIYVRSALDGGYSGVPAEYDIGVVGPKANKSNQVTVGIANRGAKDALNVKVTLGVAPRGSQEPDWKNPDDDPADENDTKESVWKNIDDVARDIPRRNADGTNAAMTVTFQWTPRAAGRYLLLAVVTCDDDRAITDSKTSLPCALRGAPVRQLVAGDNNLGLVEVTVSET